MNNTFLFECISRSDNVKIDKVYGILKSAGEYMFTHYGLIHWKTPYHVDKITIDCEVNNVYLVYSESHNDYVGTFQLRINANQNSLTINKFATSPVYLI